MTDQHPLTDDKCYELWSGNLYENERMRAAADWQLEQVIKFIAKEDTVYYDTPTLLADYIKQAMRPQEDQ